MMKVIERIFRNNKYRMTSKFGWRINPVTGKKAFHNGVDYGTYGVKAPQMALEEGIILSTKTSKTGYGNTVWVRYPRLGFSVFHAHLDKISVKKGQNVNGNTVIGLTGTTGQSTGIHAHIGIQAINSSDWLDAEKINYTAKPRYNLKRVLKFRSKGNDVKQLQIRLNELGFGLLKLDGKMGGKTTDAVISFQKKKKLSTDGEVGKNTAHKLGWLFNGK